MSLISSDGSILISASDCITDIKVKTGNGFTINTAPTPSLLLSGNGVGIPLTGFVRISQLSGNNIVLNSDGLFSPIPTFTETLLSGVNTPTVSLAFSGIASHTITATVNISTDPNNALVVHANGLYVPAITGGGTYTDAQARNAISGTAPLTYSSITGVMGITKATSTVPGYLSSSDWTTFNTKEPAIVLGTTAQYWRGDKSWQVLNTSVVTEGSNQYFTTVRARAAISATSPVQYNSATGVVSEVVATSGQDGYLSNTDWITFNSKVGGGSSLASIAALSVYKDMTTGGILEFRGIRAGTGVTIALQADDIVINATGAAPIANAGADQGIVLPTTSVTLTGAATTPSGTIESTTWLLMSGPTGSDITDATNLGSTVTGLSQGNYTLRLLVVNNQGLVDTDDMVISVAGSAGSLDTIYVGIANVGTTPTQSQILAAISSQQNGALNVTADWTTLTASGPVYCFFAIPDTDSAHEKNAWFCDALNKGSIGGSSDLFGALAVVPVNSVNYSVGITAYATQFTEVCQLQKV